MEAEALLEPYQHKYPKVSPQPSLQFDQRPFTDHVSCQGSIILFYSARIATLRGNFEKVGV